MLMLILLFLLTFATTIALIGSSMELFWFDYGATKAKGYQDSGAQYPAQEMVQDFSSLRPRQVYATERHWFLCSLYKYPHWYRRLAAVRRRSVKAACGWTETQARLAQEYGFMLECPEFRSRRTAKRRRRYAEWIEQVF